MIEVKYCNQCKRDKKVEEFPIRKWKTNTGYGSYCKKCQWTRTARYRRQNPEILKKINRKAFIKYRYGLTEEQVQQMKDNQNACCKLCSKEKKLVIDHCHSTGKVRGLLCTHCNVLLGHIENKDKMKRIEQYLNAA